MTRPEDLADVTFRACWRDPAALAAWGHRILNGEDPRAAGCRWSDPCECTGSSSGTSCLDCVLLLDAIDAALVAEQADVDALASTLDTATCDDCGGSVCVCPDDGPCQDGAS